MALQNTSTIGHATRRCKSQRPAIGLIYDAYVKRCFKNGAMDFDDCCLKCTSY
ncbi:MAG: hypothetical protein WDM90_03605 [Ferruginibacter sp.]